MWNFKFPSVAVLVKYYSRIVSIVKCTFCRWGLHFTLLNVPQAWGLCEESRGWELSQDFHQGGGRNNRFLMLQVCRTSLVLSITFAISSESKLPLLVLDLSTSTPSFGPLNFLLKLQHNCYSMFHPGCWYWTALHRDPAVWLCPPLYCPYTQQNHHQEG